MDICIIELESRQERAYADLDNTANGYAIPYMVDISPEDFCVRAFPLYLYKIPLVQFNQNVYQHNITQYKVNKGDSGVNFIFFII